MASTELQRLSLLFHTVDVRCRNRTVKSGSWRRSAIFRICRYLQFIPSGVLTMNEYRIGIQGMALFASDCDAKVSSRPLARPINRIAGDAKSLWVSELRHFGARVRHVKKFSKSCLAQAPYIWVASPQFALLIEASTGTGKTGA